MISIKDIEEEEERKMTWLDKVVRNYPRVHSTSFLSPPIKQLKPEIILRPSVLGQLVAIPFIFMAVLFCYYFLTILIKKSLPAIIPLAGILFVFFIIYLVIWHSFANPKYIYDLRINHQGIEARGMKYDWDNIAETCILLKMEGRVTVNSLVLIMRDGTTEKMSLYKFNIQDQTIAGIIEFYKKLP